MKLIIAGGRDYTLTPENILQLDALKELFPVDEVVSGGARGADRGGEVWGASRGLRVVCFPADWDRHGKAAGHIRNGQMADYADAVALFPGGRGTDNMHLQARQRGLEIFDFR